MTNEQPSSDDNDHLFNERTGSNYDRIRPLKDVFDDLDVWRNVMTRINFDNDISDEEYSALRNIHRRLDEDLLAANLD